VNGLPEASLPWYIEFTSLRRGVSSSSNSFCPPRHWLSCPSHDRMVGTPVYDDTRPACPSRLYSAWQHSTTTSLPVPVSLNHRIASRSPGALVAMWLVPSSPFMGGLVPSLLSGP